MKTPRRSNKTCLHTVTGVRPPVCPSAGQWGAGRISEDGGSGPVRAESHWALGAEEESGGMRAEVGLAGGHRPGEPRGSSERGWRQRGCRWRQDSGHTAEAWRAEAGHAWAQGVVREGAVG